MMMMMEGILDEREVEDQDHKVRIQLKVEFQSKIMGTDNEYELKGASSA